MYQLPPLYAIANADTLASPADFVASLLGAGVRLIQLRAKARLPSELRELTEHCLAARNAYATAYGPRALIVVNDDVDLCRATDADGVHLGQHDAKPGIARLTLGRDKVIGLSTHTLYQLSTAPIQHLSYLALGPIFESRTKSGHAPAVGLVTLEQAARQSSLPLVAIGGITILNAAEVYRAGAGTVAVISDLAEAENLPERVEAYAAAWNDRAR